MYAHARERALDKPARCVQNKGMKENPAPAAESVKGKPAKYTATAGASICEAVAGGASLRKACAVAGIGIATARRWMEQRPDFGQMYARACEKRQSLMEERIQELYEMAHDVAKDDVNPNAKIQAVKLELDGIKWQLSKLQPARYGEKQQIEVSGKGCEPVRVASELNELTPEAQETLLDRLRDIARREMALAAKEQEESRQ